MYSGSVGRAREYYFANIISARSTFGCTFCSVIAHCTSRNFAARSAAHFGNEFVSTLTVATLAFFGAFGLRRGIAFRRSVPHKDAVLERQKAL